MSSAEILMSAAIEPGSYGSLSILLEIMYASEAAIVALITNRTSTR